METQHPVTAQPSPRTLDFQFHGTGSEYFRIWIVNLLLTILTLGIYSAWAKVRTNRYFYLNTRLDGTGFDYLANPRDILKGRIIAGGLFILYSVSGNINPFLGLALGLVFLFAVPWLVVRSMAFRARNTAWRNVRFRFEGTVSDAVFAYIFAPILGMLTFGLLYPRAIHEQNRFLVTESSFGTTSFDFTATRRDYFRPLAIGALAMFGLMFILATVIGAALVLTRDPVFSMVVYALGFTLVMVTALAYFRVVLANLRLNHMRLGEHRFQADWKFGSYLRLVLANSLLILLTLGFFYPWAKVRSARYAAEHTKMVAASDLDEFAAGELEHVKALGEETAEFFDLEFGL